MSKHQGWEGSQCHLSMMYLPHGHHLFMMYSLTWHHPVSPLSGLLWHFLTFILIYEAPLDPLALSVYLVFIHECKGNFPGLLNHSSGMKWSQLSRHTIYFFYRTLMPPWSWALTLFWISLPDLWERLRYASQCFAPIFCLCRKPFEFS